MKRLSFVAISMAAALSMAACSDDIIAPQLVGEKQPLNVVELDTKTSQGIASAADDFAFRLFSLVNRNENKNTMVSPLSISTALSMTAMGATGDTYDEMVNAIGQSGYSVEQLGSYYKKLLAEMADSGKTKVELANSIWVDKGISLMAPFVGYAEGYYDAEIASIDFNSSEAAKAINKWCSDKTHGLIPNIIDDTASLRMALINALYFKASWADSFFSPVKEKFHGLSGDRSVDMLHKTEKLYYAEDENFQIASVPYIGGYSFDIILPKGDFTTGSAALTGENWSGLISSMKKKKVILSMPEFKFDYSINLNDVLKEMGMRRAFTAAAEFDALSEHPLLIDKVVHKTSINLDKDGTEAAAVTAVFVKDGAIAPEDEEMVELRADKPYFFVIRKTSSSINNNGGILFLGRVI